MSKNTEELNLLNHEVNKINDNISDKAISETFVKDIDFHVEATDEAVERGAKETFESVSMNGIDVPKTPHPKPARPRGATKLKIQ